ncbi:ABC transporter family substrate-binding protein [Micrococcus terreus]|uniref:ABC transporter family substrate-binding protein n=1 Tax=Micrococcus terreus TaxID=574650 RepID=UPI00254A627E|nr:ABC transporter family substrate-binding protein [Micrococcus terreus]MDK7700422.1 ABC transporter family substrate-binding protein [Micrococcus terreus]WOO98745.1 ABC transporter family substrate-binding protein [Micrococcus terreus]
MKFTKLSAAAALVAGSALVLSACAPAGPADNNNGGSGNTQSADGGNGGELATGEFGNKLTVEPEDPTALADLGDVETKEGSVAYSVGEDEFTSYNGVQSNTYSTYNSAVADRLFSSFYYFGTDGTIHPNEDLGTYELISEDPMQVKYTINPDAKWSDGTDVTALDYQLQWAADNANITNADGDQLFDSISAEAGLRIPDMPEGDPAGKEFTVTYAEPYADWQIMIGSALPAHVVAEQSGMSTEDMAAAIEAKDGEALADAADFWNNGWDFTPGELPDESIIPSMGPYKLKADGWTAGQSITLEANDAWWGTPAATKELVIRFSAADTHVQALQNQELNVIEPQATVDTVEQLEGLGDQVVIQTGQELTWEHLDFNFMEGRAFADNLELRKAFAMCVPRQRIVDNLIKPIDEEATVMNAREVFPFQDTYQEVLDASYGGEYDEVDIEGAKAILEAEDAVGTSVTIGYNSPNPRRTETVALIQSSCEEAGFKIEDGGNANFFTEVKPAGDYDVALFAWAGSGQKASGRNIYHTDGNQNDVEYSDATVDEAWDTLATSLDEAEQLEQVKIIEKALWDTLFGIPLYAHPGVTAHSADLANVRFTAAQSGALWNVEQWAWVTAE